MNFQHLILGLKIAQHFEVCAVCPASNLRLVIWTNSNKTGEHKDGKYKKYPLMIGDFAIWDFAGQGSGVGGI